MYVTIKFHILRVYILYTKNKIIKYTMDRNNITGETSEERQRRLNKNKRNLLY